MKTLGISIYISYILGLHPWWILHAGRVHWCWTSETLGARHGIIIFFIMSSIWDFISCTTFWISMLLLSQVLVSLQYRVGPLGFLCLPDDQIGGNVGLMDQVGRENGERNVKLTTATTAYKNILQISCWLCNGCTITSQTLEATLTEWPSRWIKLDIVVLWPQLCYFHQLLDEMVT